MLQTIFLRYLSITVTTGALTGLLLLISPLLRKRYTEKWKYWLWLFLALYLILPVSIPKAKVHVVANIPDTQAAVRYSFGIPEIIWILGIIIFILYHFIGQQVFYRSVLRNAVSPQNQQLAGCLEAVSQEMHLGKASAKSIRLLICKSASGPMTLGLIHPVLILPKEEYTDEELRFILLHELYHCKRKDLWYKLILFCANAIHWFNPLVRLMCREAGAALERTCDDAILQGASYEERRAYTETILQNIKEQIAYKNNLSMCLYGGKKEMKNRFMNILEQKKRQSGNWVLLLAVVCMLFAGGMFAFAAPNTEADAAGQNEGKCVIYHSALDNVKWVTETEKIYTYSLHPGHK